MQCGDENATNGRHDYNDQCKGAVRSTAVTARDTSEISCHVCASTLWTRKLTWLIQGAGVTSCAHFSDAQRIVSVALPPDEEITVVSTESRRLRAGFGRDELVAKRNSVVCGVHHAQVR